MGTCCAKESGNDGELVVKKSSDIPGVKPDNEKDGLANGFAGLTPSTAADEEATQTSALRTPQTSPAPSPVERASGEGKVEEHSPTSNASPSIPASASPLTSPSGSPLVSPPTSPLHAAAVEAEAGNKEIDWEAEADAVLQQAEKLWQEDALALEAEAVLVGYLDRVTERLRKCGGSPVGADSTGTAAVSAARRVRESAICKEVLFRTGQFSSLQSVLAPSDFKLRWQKKDACLWVHAPAGETWFEYKIAGLVDSPLHLIWLMLDELDLQPRYQTMLCASPQEIGPQQRHLLRTRSLISMLVFRVELIIEVMRFVDKKFGFLAERVRSDFPTDGLDIPGKSWRNMRISVDTKQLAIPVGGGADGTILVQTTRVETGIAIPSRALNFFCDTLSMDYLDSLRKATKLLDAANNPWAARLVADKKGLYKELEGVHQASATRHSISAMDLPCPEIFERPWCLEETLRQMEGVAFST
eukprot:TRINITY_DN17482_c0_g1_i2.p1 TRINITY_DN17482_c0_g1~~TRINITY_DN17482_c0_g1_i2.p1  ORF type:complete len:472 (-),score=87.57 TRINITY_DN17482_c0_g1_i2:624-2039(-)